MVQGETAGGETQDGSTVVGRVLVVDDEPAIAGLIRDVLTRQGYDVTTSEGGEDALQEAAAGRYDLVISDYAIPGMSGLEFARRLRSSRPEARVLIVSAFLDPRAVEELDAEPNVVGLMRKPFDIFELITRVDEQLGVSQPEMPQPPIHPGNAFPTGGASRGTGIDAAPDRSGGGLGEGPPATFMDPGAFH